jgi:hypothetical protein
VVYKNKCAKGPSKVESARNCNLRGIHFLFLFQTSSQLSSWSDGGSGGVDRAGVSSGAPMNASNRWSMGDRLSTGSSMGGGGTSPLGGGTTGLFWNNIPILLSALTKTNSASGTDLILDCDTM